MSDMATARWNLPFLAVAQAQKEVTHNEALALIDLLLHPSATAIGTNTPPASPAIGECWLLGSAPTGAWSGRAGQIAGWTSGGWRFILPRPMMRIHNSADGQIWQLAPSGWAAAPIVSPPTGGTVIDSESRVVLAALIAALAGQGILQTQ